MQNPSAPQSSDTALPWSGARFALGTAGAAWSLYLAVALVRCLVYGFNHPWMLIERHALTALVAVGLAWAIYLLARRYDGHAMRQRLVVVLLAALPAAALLSVINYNVMYVFAPDFYLHDMGMDMHLTLLGEVLHSSIENYFVFAAWGALYTAVSHAMQTQDLLRRAAASEAAAHAAELRALRLQLDPHFLFNALNTVSGLIMAGQLRDADSTVEALAAFLRATLEVDATHDIPLAEELRLQEIYLQIEQVRFGGRLQVTLDIEEGLQAACVPALLLQPIVENSIRHGVAQTSRQVHVALTARRQGELLAIELTDDGPVESPAPGHGIGLRNVAARLGLRYGVRAGMTSGRQADGLYRTALWLPLAFPEASA